MSRHRKTRAGNKVRVDLQRPGFLIPAPDAPWIECVIVEVSDEGVCLEVGSLAMPKIFGLAFTASGEIFRACRLNWLQWGTPGRALRVGKGAKGQPRIRQGRPTSRKSCRHIPQR